MEPPPLLPPTTPPEIRIATWAKRGAAVGVLVPALILLAGSIQFEPLIILGGMAGIGAHLVWLFFLLKGIVLSFFARTRSYGLGLLLGCAVFLLVELTICGSALAIAQ